MTTPTPPPYTYLDERRRILDWLTHHEMHYRKGSKERQLLDTLYKQVESGKIPPQGRMI